MSELELLTEIAHTLNLVYTQLFLIAIMIFGVALLIHGRGK